LTEAFKPRHADVDGSLRIATPNPSVTVRRIDLIVCVFAPYLDLPDVKHSADLTSSRYMSPSTFAEGKRVAVKTAQQLRDCETANHPSALLKRETRTTFLHASRFTFHGIQGCFDFSEPLRATASHSGQCSTMMSRGLVKR
jgi:hypothetical protein